VSKLLCLNKDTNQQGSDKTILFRISLTPCFGIRTASAQKDPQDVH